MLDQDMMQPSNPSTDNPDPRGSYQSQTSLEPILKQDKHMKSPLGGQLVNGGAGDTSRAWKLDNVIARGGWTSALQTKLADFTALLSFKIVPLKSNRKLNRPASPWKIKVEKWPVCAFQCEVYKVA